jgi:hypothetical protein
LILDFDDEAAFFELRIVNQILAGLRHLAPMESPAVVAELIDTFTEA